MPGCGKVKFYASGNKVRVRGGAFKASADCVEACTDGNLVLQGNVRVKCTECDCGAALRRQGSRPLQGRQGQDRSWVSANRSIDFRPRFAVCLWRTAKRSRGSHQCWSVTSAMNDMSPCPTSSWNSMTATASYEARSRASGAVHCELPPGAYTVTLQKAGYGAKRVSMTAWPGQPYHFRLLSDCLLGYAWPKCVRAGEKAEFRVHSVEPYKLELWRYGWRKEFVRGLGWHDEHGPRATMQITPDGDYTQTGVGWNQRRLLQPASSAIRRSAAALRPVLLPRPDQSGGLLLVSVGRGAGRADSDGGGAGLGHHLERLQQLRRPQQLHPRRPLPADADRQLAAGVETLHRPRTRDLGRRHPTHRCRSTGRSRSITSTCTRTSPIPSRAAPPATSPRPSGGCSAGWNARASPTTSTPRRSSTAASST